MTVHWSSSRNNKTSTINLKTSIHYPKTIMVKYSVCVFHSWVNRCVRCVMLLMYCNVNFVEWKSLTNFQQNLIHRQFFMIELWHTIVNTTLYFEKLRVWPKSGACVWVSMNAMCGGILNLLTNSCGPKLCAIEPSSNWYFKPNSPYQC